MTRLEHSTLSPAILTDQRPGVRGKFLFVGDEKLYIRGVTYGTFRPGEDGHAYPAPPDVARDFAQMAANGINAVRTYTPPPRWLLDCAQRHGIRVMVGLPWEQHVAFLDDRRRVEAIKEGVRAGAHACAGHPAVLCYAIGNEIPASIVRWYGHRRVEHFLEQLYTVAKAADPGALVTYVNYPSTEYLHLPFLDFVAFNVYLETQERLHAYLARLHNLAGDRPLLMAEVGLDSRRHGREAQAETLRWQVHTTFDAGCAGTFIFSWTDEWHRGGYDVDDWDFGLTDRERRPKPALDAVRAAFAAVPFSRQTAWPRVSVVVCSHNGQRTMRDCCEGLLRLDYPDYEVIVVDDGSSDATAAIAREYGFTVISTPNAGLSAARTRGLRAASGEIVAYLDDDAYPDAHWLMYLAATFMNTSHAGVGGPNIPPPGDGPIADCVANAPGGPIHVLLSDHEAEHIPGCNMAFRRRALLDVGGFDPQFWVAGDDVDVCWQLQQRGDTLGFSPAAMVWHHRRSSIRAYWKQQQGYGTSEALLERKWPEKYNAAGHLTWSGRLYGRGLTLTLGWRRKRIAYGTWGNAEFQPAHHLPPGLLGSLPLVPEWHLLSVALLVLSALGLLWTPLLCVLPLALLVVGASLLQAVLSARRAVFTSRPSSRMKRLKLYALTAFLHVMQPLARLYGRRVVGRFSRRRSRRAALPRQRVETIWSERWQSTETWLRSIEIVLQADGAPVVRGGDFDRWDLQVRCGAFGAARVHTAIEEHGGGKQLLRVATRPWCSALVLALPFLLAVLALGAAAGHVWIVAAMLGAAGGLLALAILHSCARAVGTVHYALGTVAAQGEQRGRQAAGTGTAAQHDPVHVTHLLHAGLPADSEVTQSDYDFA